MSHSKKPLVSFAVSACALVGLMAFVGMEGAEVSFGPQLQLAQVTQVGDQARGFDSLAHLLFDDSTTGTIQA